jgi:hypothetical protein
MKVWTASSVQASELLTMIRSLAPHALLGSLSLLGLGCFVGEDHEAAGRGMHAMLEVVGPGSDEVFELSHPWRSAAPFGAPRVDGEVVPCPDGGELRLTGWTSMDPERASALDALYALELEVEFQRCEVDGVVLRGEIEYTFSQGPGWSLLEPSLEWSYLGQIRFEGELEGTCDVDMVATAHDIDALGDAEARSYDGWMCDLDAEAVAAHAHLETAF